MWPFSRKPIVKPINETSLVPLSNGARSFIDAINKSKQKIAEFNRLKEKVEMDITQNGFANEKDLYRLRMILNEIIALLSDTLDKRLDAKLENIEELVDDVQRSIEAIRKYKGKPKMKAA